MLEAALKARFEERERANDAESVEILVLKRKSELIDHLSKNIRDDDANYVKYGSTIHLLHLLMDANRAVYSSL